MNRILKRLVVLLMALVVLTLCGCGAKADSAASTTDNGTVAEAEPEYPQIAYIDNVSYYGTGEVCEMVPRKAPDGTIETFVDKAIMPDAYNSANFGADQGKLEYMLLEDNQMIIHIGEEWYYFEAPIDSPVE